MLDTTGVAYIYPEGLRSLLWRRSLRLRLRSGAAALGTAAFAVLRVSFGVLLLLSLAIVVVVMLVLIARSGGGGSTDRHGRQGLEGAFRLMRPRRPMVDVGDIYFWFWWREWWLHNPFFFGWDAQAQARAQQQAEARRRRVLEQLDEEEAGASSGSGSGSMALEGSGTRSTRRRTPSMSMHRRAVGGRYGELEEDDEEEDFEEEEDMTFLEAVFSLLFGDGNPGPSENERWQRIARLIHEKQGVVVAEEVVPLLTDARGAEQDADQR